MTAPKLTHMQHLNNLFAAAREIAASAKIHDQLRESYAALVPLATEADRANSSPTSAPDEAPTTD